MKTIWRSVLALAGAVALCFGALAAGGPARAQTDENLWDTDHGVVVTRYSPVLDLRPELGPFTLLSYPPGHLADHSDIMTMFAGPNQWEWPMWVGFLSLNTYIEEGQHTTLFDDYKPAGFVHFVEWKARGLMNLNRVQLAANGDGPEWLNNRDFARFTLYYRDPGTGSWVQFYNFTPPHPEVVATNPLDVTLPTPIVAQEFRAEFEQYLQQPISWFNQGGPRIRYLKGFGTYAGPLDPPAPKAVIEKMLGAYRFWNYPPLGLLEPGGPGVADYFIVRNMGNAPALSVTIDSAVFQAPNPVGGLLALDYTDFNATLDQYVWTPIAPQYTHHFGVDAILRPYESRIVLLPYSSNQALLPAGEYPVRMRGTYWSWYDAVTGTYSGPASFTTAGHTTVTLHDLTDIWGIWFYGGP